MKPPRKRNAPDRVQAIEGVEQSVRVATNCSEYSPSPRSLQSSALALRFGLPPSLARRLAELAYGELA